MPQGCPSSIRDADVLTSTYTYLGLGGELKYFSDDVLDAHKAKMPLCSDPKNTDIRAALKSGLEDRWNAAAALADKPQLKEAAEKYQLVLKDHAAIVKALHYHLTNNTSAFAVTFESAELKAFSGRLTQRSTLNDFLNLLRLSKQYISEKGASLSSEAEKIGAKPAQDLTSLFPNLPSKHGQTPSVRFRAQTSQLWNV